MSQDTIRLHLNTRDGQPYEGDDNNQCNVKFDVRKAHIKAKPGKALSVALVKATIPQNTTPIPYVTNKKPVLAFTLSSADSPNVAGTELLVFASKLNASSNLLNMYSSALATTEVFYPFDYTVGKNQLLGVINALINGQFSNNTAPDVLVQHRRTGALSTDETEDGGTSTLSINIITKYFQKGNPDFNSGAYNVAQRLGLNVKYTGTTITLGLNSNISTVGEYPMTTYQAPILVETNLSLNSANSQEPSDTHTLSSIPVVLSVVNSEGSTDLQLTQDNQDEDDTPWENIDCRNIQDNDERWSLSGKKINSDDEVYGVMLPAQTFDPNYQAPVVLFSGAPVPLDGACIHPSDPHKVMLFSGTDYYIYSLDTQQKLEGPINITDTFPQTTGTVKSVFRNSHLGTNSAGEDLYHQILIYEDNGWFTRYQASNNWYTDPTSTHWRAQESWKDYDAESLSHLDERLYFKDGQFWDGDGRDSQGNWLGWQNYGDGTGKFEGLPSELHAVIVDQVNNKTYAFKDTTIYDLNTDHANDTYTINASYNYGSDGSITQNNVQKQVNLDGADDFISIPLTDDRCLNWTQSWSIGIKCSEIHNIGNAQKATIVRRGNNGIYFSKGSGNWGFYATAVDGVHDPPNNQGMSHSHGANTWFVPPTDDAKFLFTYNHISGKLRWYCDDVLKATVQMTATEMTIGVNTSDPLLVGKEMGGYYGGRFWDGHVDNLILMNTNLVDGSQQITDYFSDDDFASHEYYNLVTNLFTLGEDAHPSIEDSLTNVSGTHYNGTESDYIPSGAVAPTTSASPASNGPPNSTSNYSYNGDNYIFDIITDPDPANWEVHLTEKPRLYGGARWYVYDIDPNDDNNLRWKSSWNGNFARGGNTGVVGDTEWENETEGANWRSLAPTGNTAESLNFLDTTATIHKINYNVNESHKLCEDENVTDIVLQLRQPDGLLMYGYDNIYYELEFKYNPVINNRSI